MNVWEVILTVLMVIVAMEMVVTFVNCLNKGKSMATIPRRDEVLKKLERKFGSELQAVNDSVATVLNEAKVFPVRFAAGAFGTADEVRSTILSRLKDAGWIVTRENPDDKESNWLVR